MLCSKFNYCGVCVLGAAIEFNTELLMLSNCWSVLPVKVSFVNEEDPLIDHYPSQAGSLL